MQSEFGRRQLVIPGELTATIATHMRRKGEQLPASLLMSMINHA
jgi:hypothetical protein